MKVSAVTSRHRIELNLREMGQLFNSMDPSPFHEKDLDHDAEEFIFSWAQEFRPTDRLNLCLYLEQWPVEDPTAAIRAAVHNYFSYRAKITQLEFRRLLKQGRMTLLIGGIFLSACLLASKLLQPMADHTWAGVIREGLTIAGWVAMWKPMELYLYDWWPLRRRWRVYIKLSRMPIEVAQRKKR